VIVDLTALPHALMLLGTDNDTSPLSTTALRGMRADNRRANTTKSIALAVHQLTTNSRFNIIGQRWVDNLGKGEPPAVEEASLVLLGTADHLLGLRVERVVPWLGAANEVHDLDLIAELDKSRRVRVEHVRGHVIDERQALGGIRCAPVAKERVEATTDL